MLCKPGAEALDFVQGDALGAAELAGRRGLKADFLAIPFGDKVRGWPECLARQTDYQLSAAATNDTRSLSRYYIRGAPVQP